jgi:hypothetical protein
MSIPQKPYWTDTRHDKLSWHHRAKALEEIERLQQKIEEVKKMADSRWEIGFDLPSSNSDLPSSNSVSDAK